MLSYLLHLCVNYLKDALGFAYSSGHETGGDKCLKN